MRDQSETDGVSAGGGGEVVVGRSGRSEGGNELVKRPRDGSGATLD